jgi:phenylpropionate dioxygenase-like ring-hydroxylating dioxygenase large terminal subunit
MEVSEDLPFKVLRKTWQPVALSSDLRPGKALSYHLLDTEIVVVRFADGKLLASDNSCPHKGMRLSHGSVDGSELQCAYHGWRFDNEGSCTNIPSLINPPANKLEASQLARYQIQERYGMIWVQMEKSSSGRLPDIPEFEDLDWTYTLGPPTIFKSGFRREIENYLDMTHFAFAHSTTLGRAADSVVPRMKIEEYHDGFLMDAPFPALKTPHEQPGKLQSAHRRRQRCYLPNFTTIRQTFENGDERILVHIPSPNSLHECTVFWALAISKDFRGPTPEEQIDFAIRVLDEDRVMCENQIPHEVPINPARGGWGVLVTPGDTLANTFQKVFRKFLLARQAELSD